MLSRFQNLGTSIQDVKLNMLSVRKVMKVELGAGFIGEVERGETAPEMMQGCIEGPEKHV